MIHIKINGLPKMPNQLLRKHWAVISQESKKWHFLVKMAVNPLLPKEPHDKVKIVMIRHSSREPDRDGLSGSFKYVMDGLVTAGVMTDDRCSVVVECKYEWKKSKLKDQHIEIIVEPAKS